MEGLFGGGRGKERYTTPRDFPEAWSPRHHNNLLSEPWGEERKICYVAVTAA